MLIANVLGGAIVLFFGLVIRVFKASWLIAGYNTASKKEKAKYNEEELTKFVGNMLILSAGILLAGGLLSAYVNRSVFIINISWGLFTAFIIGGVIYMNKGNRFKK